MAKRELPDEIIVEIFSRLPAKSAGKCRCLSKFWNTYLSTPLFIKLHLQSRCQTHNLENNSIIFLDPSNRSLHVITSPFKNKEVSKQTRVLNTTEWFAIRGSCNGLVMLESMKGDMFLVNPVTSQQLKIPHARNCEAMEMFGFGYDSASDDYKVVKLSCYTEPKRFVDVYSVRKATWKRVNNSTCPIYTHHGLAFANGAVHWLSTSTRPGSQPHIVAFDLEYEVFREIPVSFYVRKYYPFEFVVLGECLCVILHEYSTGTVDLLIMKEYGVADSWIRYHISALAIRPVCFLSGDEFLCLRGSRDWTVYNVKEQTTKDLVVGGVSGDKVVVFVDSLSLVNLDQFV